MPTITGHFEAVVRGEQHCVSFIFDSDDKEAATSASRLRCLVLR